MKRIALTTLAALLGGIYSSSAIITVQALYRMGEAGVGSGNLPLDSSGNGHDFVTPTGNAAAGVATNTTSPPPGSTVYYTFDANDTGFSDVGWDPPEDNLGVECWARAFDLSYTTGITPGTVVFGTGNNLNGLGILYDDFGIGFVGVLGNVDYVGLPYTPASTNEWVHLAVVRDNGVSTFYVNGVARTPIRTSGINNSTIPFMGYSTDTTKTNFAGAIDEARIFTFNPGEFFPKDLLIFQSTNTRPYVTSFKGSLEGFTVKVQDKTTTINTNTVIAQLDGTNVIATISQAGGLTTVMHVSPAYLASGSSHAATLIFADSASVYQTNQLSFVVAPYTIVPASFVMAAGTVDTNQPGFKVRPYQTAATQPNTLAWTEDQLIGLHGANIADLSGADAGGYYANSNVVNYNIEAGSVERGDFPNDVSFPGIPGTSGLTGNSAMELLTFLQFPAAGVYHMGVNSDDGFKVTTGRNPRDRFALVLGQFDGGRGASDTLFTIVVQQAGLYPFRLIWENGNGELPNNQASCEWFSVKPDGTKVLVNDTNTPGAILAYRAGTLPPFISRVAPGIGERGVLPSALIAVDVTDDGTLVNGSSIRLGLDGGAMMVPTSLNKTGAVTTATLTPASPFPVSSTHTAQVTWSDTGSFSASNAWQFVVLDAFLPPGLGTPLGSGDSTKRGFRVHTFQANYDIQTELPIADQMIHGVAWGTDVSDQSTAVNGEFTNDLVNWNRDAGSVDIGFFQSPDYPDSPHPGIPGTTASYANFASEALTFVEFPTAGVFTMGVNSDDGFRVTAGDGTGPDFGALRIISPANLASNYAGWPTYFANGGLFGGPLPRPIPFVRRLVKADDGTTTTDIDTLNAGDNSASYTFLRAAPTNVTDLAGNIAVVRRGGGITFAQKSKYCQDAGAVAVIVVNRPDLAGSLPFGMGGSDPSVTIPCIMIDWGEYSNFWASVTTRAATTITVSVGEDASPLLGQFDGGRGQGDPTLFSFYVPQAGLYPLRLLFYQGQGGASCEWFSVDGLGNYVLLNDTNNPAALKTYRARTVATRGRLNPVLVSGNNVTLSWTGTGELLEADSLAGPWNKSPDQLNPQTRTAAGRQKLFRLRVY